MVSVQKWTETPESFIAPTYFWVAAIKLSGLVICLICFVLNDDIYDKGPAANPKNEGADRTCASLYAYQISDDDNVEISEEGKKVLKQLEEDSLDDDTKDESSDIETEEAVLEVLDDEEDKELLEAEIKN